MSKSRARKIVAGDCETDPFVNGRVPKPFIWGTFDGEEMLYFQSAAELVSHWRDKHATVYFHNGGRYDFHLGILQDITEDTRALIINGRVVELKIGDAIFRDSYAIIPVALEAYKKTKTEYWKFEAAIRADHMPEILAYLRDDCVNLHELVSAYCAAAGNKSTIASNALAFCRKRGTDPGRTNSRFDAHFREFYFGGRVEDFLPGHHKQLNCFDIKSSYPFAMVHDHATGSEFITDDTLSGYSDDDIRRAFIELHCFSEGAFPLQGRHGQLTFPHAFGTYKVTGWEYMTAKKHGLIKGERIIRAHFFADTITFRDYVEHWFDHKQEAERRGDAAQRIVGKIMMNSLYGKLAQNPRKYKDYVIRPLGTPVDYEQGWNLEYEFEGREVHARPTLWKYTRDRDGNERPAEYVEERPIFFNVATGASVTGFARAHLLDAIHTVGARSIAYCDTDCVFVTPSGDTLGLRQDGALGSWQWEGLAAPAYIAGKKLYAMKMINGPSSGKEKIASKGARLTFADIKRLTEGETITWNNDAPSFSLARKPIFVRRKIRATSR